MPPGSASPSNRAATFHAVPIDIVPLDDHIAEVDADTIFNAPVLWHVFVAACHRTLRFSSTLDGIDDASELNQKPVARRLDDAADMLGNMRFDDFFAVGLELGKRSRLISAHQTAIADDICAEDGGESTFFSLRGHWSSPR